jgi:hypothetical protein
MKIVNITDGGVPNMDGRGKLIEEQKFLVVLTQDDAGLFAAYCAIVRDDPARREMDAVHVAHGGAKLSYRRAVAFFPQIAEREYRA